MTKRLLAFLLSVIMVFSMMPAMTFMSLAEEAPAMGDDGKVYVFTDGVDSTWHTIGPEDPFQVIGAGGVYNNGATYDCYYENASMMGVLFEVTNVNTPVTLSNKPIKALSKNKDGGTTEYIWGGSDNAAAAGDEINEDGIYMYLAQPLWWSQSAEMMYCAELRDISFVTSAGCSMRVLGIVEVPQPAACYQDWSAYIPNLTSEIKYVSAVDKTTPLGTQTSTISTGWRNPWSDSFDSSLDKKPIVKKVDLLESKYQPELNENEEFNGWKVVGTDASVTCAAGQFTVYPDIRTASLDAVTVTFMNGPDVIAAQKVEKGEPISYTGPEPVKSDEEEFTYLFRGWKNEAGELADLNNYTADADVTLTADFTKVTKTKVTLKVIEAAGFDKPGKYGIKLNRTDITLPNGETTPITGGTVTVSGQDFTNGNGEKEFTVTFDKINENGEINAEIELIPPAGGSGIYSADFSGSVTGTDGVSAKIFKTTEEISTLGKQQAGKYYGESAEARPLNKTVVGEDGNAVKTPDFQVVWNDNVDFGSGYTGITYVMKATGIDTDKPVILSNLNGKFLNDSNSEENFKWHGNFNNRFWGGATEPIHYMKISEDGYYLLYFNYILVDFHKFCGARELYVFDGDGTDPVSEGSPENTVKDNRNENAAIQMVAVVGGNLQPTVTFHNEDGTVYETPYQHKYTDVADSSDDGNLVKQTMKLITVGEAIEKAKVPTPVKASDDSFTYTFDGWVDAAGNAIDTSAVFYMNTDVYAHFKATAKTTKYTVTFKNGDEVFGTSQEVWENEVATAPEGTPAKADDATGTFKFAGWSQTKDGGVESVVDLANVPITKDTTFYAVYTHEAVSHDLMGDVNDDGAITVEDVTALSRYAAGWDGCEIADLGAADVDFDGELTAADVTILSRCAAGWDGYELGYKE